VADVQCYVINGFLRKHRFSSPFFEFIVKSAIALMFIL
jgi:hypothetical protein